MRKALIATIGAAVLATTTFAVTESASAATIRYASPTGSGTACTQAAPCTLTEAVTAAGDGDTVQLTADEYNLSSTLNIWANDLTIAGPTGMTNPSDFLAFIIFGGSPTDSKIQVYGNNVRFERLAITGTADGSAHIVGGDNATYDRVRIANYGESDTLSGLNVTLRDSYISQTGSSNLGSAVTISGTITGSTIYSAHGTAILQSGGYIRSTTYCTTTIRNTLAWGGQANLDVDNSGGTCTPLTTDFDYSWISNIRSASTGGGVNIGGGFSNLVVGPHNLPNETVVFDPSDPGDTYLSNLILPPDSPAVNAGCSDRCSDHDYYGRPRPIGDANDIGAVEQYLPPALSALNPDSLSATEARLSLGINPRGAASTYSIQYRKSGDSAWTTHLDGDITAALFTPTSVSTTLTGLQANTQYEVRAIANNARGAATPSTITLRTLQPSVSVSALKAKLTKKKGKLTSKVTTSDPGTITQVAKVGSSTKKRCKTTKTAPDSGTYSLTCPLTKKTRNQLRQKALKFKVTTTLTTADGAKNNQTTTLKVKRKR